MSIAVARLKIFTMSLMLSSLLLSYSATIALGNTAASNYQLTPIEFSPGTPIGQCQSWSGGSDGNGHFYLACPGPDAPYVYELDQNGKYLRYAKLPAEYLFALGYRMRDVAVSPDGNTMYVSVGPIIDNLGPNPTNANGSVSGSILRFIRQANQSWAWDSNYRAGPFLLGGNYWAARYLDVDTAGRVYTSVNGFIFELHPVTGALTSFFGGITTAWPNGPWVEGLDVAQGLSVQPDGNALLVVDQRHNIIQRWQRIGADWQRDTTWGPNRNGLLGLPSIIDASYCHRNDTFQSPYDLGVDAAGDIYIVDVSCHRIQRYDSNGNFLQTVWSNAYTDEEVHGFAVNFEGSIIIPELETKLLRIDRVKKPVIGGGGPKKANAPIVSTACVAAKKMRINNVTVPRRSNKRRVTVQATLNDPCTKQEAIEIRVFGADKGSRRWSSGLTKSVILSGYNGNKVLQIQVRRNGKEISQRFRATTRLNLTQPSLQAHLRAPKAKKNVCSKVNPLARLQNRKQYRLTAPCLTIIGKVIRTKRVQGTYQIELELPPQQARKVYRNAISTTRIWVATDQYTTTGKIRRGKRVKVTTPIIAQRNLRNAFAMPAQRIV